jgi:hypothetical protein
MTTRALARRLMVLALLMAMWAAGEASAGLFRSYLSVNGSDANPCTLQSPCRLLPAALAVTNGGGEVWMLDSANFNVSTVNVTQTVTILAVPGALGSVVANGADAIGVNAPGVKLTLRNVVVLNLSGTLNTGVSFVQGATLTLEGCEVYGLNNGVSASASGSVVSLKDSTIRDNSNGVVIAGGVRAVLRGTSILNNATAAVVASNGAGVAIAGSTLAGSLTGLQVSASGSTTTQVAVSATSISGNTTGVQVVASTGSDTAEVVLNNVAISQSGSGVSITGTSATVYSRQNNMFKFNTTDVGSGTLTPLAAQ